MAKTLYKYYCKNKKTGIEMWLDSPCAGWKVLKKEVVNNTQSGLIYSNKY